jgi:hypothetical protein
VAADAPGARGGVEGEENGGGRGGAPVPDAFPTLSAATLHDHDRGTRVKTEVERRQFNCPICPEEGRGKQVFFKRVPAEKPIVKCTKCKKAKQKHCDRLYPIPKGEEKGYGKKDALVDLVVAREQ